MGDFFKPFVKFRENACVLLKAGFEWGAFFWF
jgi:hypothetical protein